MRYLKKKKYFRNIYLPHRQRRLFCKVEVELYFLFLSGIQGLFLESQLWIGTRLRLLSLDLVDEFPRRQANLLKFPRTEIKYKNWQKVNFTKKSMLQKTSISRKTIFQIYFTLQKCWWKNSKKSVKMKLIERQFHTKKLKLVKSEFSSAELP